MKTHDRPEARGKAGVTLIEMLVVVTIIALFVALGRSASMFKRADEARVTAARAQINNLSDRAGRVQTRYRHLPHDRAGSAALRVAPDDMPQWNGPVLAAGRSAGSVGPPVYLQVSG